MNVKRAAIECERKMRSNNFELSEAMEKHMMSMAREAEKLRLELANAEKRAMVAVVDAVSAANPGNSYKILLFLLCRVYCFLFYFTLTKTMSA